MEDEVAEPKHWQHEINSTEKLIARQAAEAERAAVVKWLRDQYRGRLQSPIFLADAIEAREHLESE